MMFRSLAIATDIMVEGGASKVTELPDRFVVTTPAQPNYWFGNCTIFKDYDDDIGRQLDCFHQDHPSAKHICLQWDKPNLGRQPGHDRLQAEGFQIDCCDVLTLGSPGARFDLPEGIECREITSTQDWDQVIDLQSEIGIAEQSYEPVSHRAYLKRSFAHKRRLIEDGYGVWLGLFDGALLVADLGVLSDGRLARYQSVETRADYRQRGLCAALVGRSLDWIATHQPGALPVILADQAAPSGRIYRKCGFSLKETLISAVKPGY